MAKHAFNSFYSGALRFFSPTSFLSPVFLLARCPELIYGSHLSLPFFLSFCCQCISWKSNDLKGLLSFAFSLSFFPVFHIISSSPNSSQLQLHSSSSSSFRLSFFFSGWCVFPSLSLCSSEASQWRCRTTMNAKWGETLFLKTRKLQPNFCPETVVFRFKNYYYNVALSIVRV